MFNRLNFTARARRRWRHERAFIESVSVCGYLADPPSPRAVRWLRRVALILANAQAGRVKVIGRENLAEGGPRVIAPNHVGGIDGAVMPFAIDGPFRCMADKYVFRLFFGLAGLLIGRVGAFAVDQTIGKAGPAREAAVRVLTSGQTLLIFPEGSASLDGTVGPFKKGAVRITKEAAEALGTETSIVPVALIYKRNAGKWMLRVPKPYVYLAMMLCGWYYRRGVIVVIGEPISSADLPVDDDQAIEVVRQAVIALGAPDRLR